MNHVYRYADGTFLTSWFGTTSDLQQAMVGSSSELGGKAGRATILRKRKGLEKMPGKVVPVPLTLKEFVR